MPPTKFVKALCFYSPTLIHIDPTSRNMRDTAHAKSGQVPLSQGDKASLGPLVLKTALSLLATFG